MPGPLKWSRIPSATPSASYGAIVRLDVRYPDGTHHTVAPRGPRTTIGRDPACDLVLNQARVSRYHAEIDQSPGGLFVRDTQSVNGLYLNGRRVERAALVAGDEIRLGDVKLVILDEIAGDASLAHASAGQGPSSADSGALDQAPAIRQERPLTLSVLATMWLVVLPLALTSAIVLALLPSASASRPVALLVGLALLALAAGALGFGILARRRWALVTHLALCALAAPTCLLTPFALATGMYLLHPRTRAHFRATPGPTDGPRRPPNEAAFTTATLGSLVAAVLIAVAFLSGTRLPSRLPYPSAWASDASVLDRLRAMRIAEESFRQVCNVGYADIDALRRPESAIPGYPPTATPFIAEDLARLEAHGYRFELSVTDPMRPTPDCPTLRRYRSFRYTATPASGKGRFYLLQSDGSIHASENRPASPEDPDIEPH